jgi:hypothetical protein
MPMVLSLGGKAPTTHKAAQNLRFWGSVGYEMLSGLELCWAAQRKCQRSEAGVTADRAALGLGFRLEEAFVGGRKVVGQR